MSEMRVFSARLPLSLIRRIKIYCFDNNIQIKDAAFEAITDWLNKMESVSDTVPQTQKKRKLSAKVLHALEIMKEQPELSNSEVAKIAGVSRQTVYNKRKELKG